MDKTCGTCAHRVDGWCDITTWSTGDSERCSVPTEFGGMSWEARTDSVEQIARDMVQEYRKLMDICVLSGPKAWEMVHVTAEDAERRLEALGVDV